MRFPCDVHIPMRLSKHLQRLGFESEHVNNVLKGYSTRDIDIANYCDENNLILITKDRDFKNSFLLGQTPARLIKINLGNVSSSKLVNIIEQNMRSIKTVSEKLDSFMIEFEQDGALTVTK